jgi:hypothetical protein
LLQQLHEGRYSAARETINDDMLGKHRKYSRYEDQDNIKVDIRRMICLDVNSLDNQIPGYFASCAYISISINRI